MFKCYIDGLNECQCHKDKDNANNKLAEKGFSSRKWKYLKVKMNGEILENVTSEKLLSVTIKQILSWEEYINCVVRKINFKYALIMYSN